MSRHGMAIGLALWALAHAAPCAAQEMTTTQREEARGLFEAGRAAFADGRYEAALDYFERSYEISQLAELLYNIGHTADRIRRDARALEAFEQYLAARPDAPERAAVEARISVLRAAVAEREAQEAREAEARAEIATEPTEPEPATPENGVDASQSTSPAGWIVLGGGGAVAVAGAVFLGLAEARAAEVRDAQEGTPWARVRDAHAQADSFAIVGGVLLGAGAAAAAAGLVMAFTLGEAQVEAALAPGGAVARGRF